MPLVSQDSWNMCCSFLDTKWYGVWWSSMVLKVLTNSPHVWLMLWLSQESLVMLYSRSTRNSSGLKFFRQLIFGLLSLHNGEWKREVYSATRSAQKILDVCIVEIARSKTFWDRTVHSPQNPTHWHPVDIFSFSIRPARGPLNNYTVYIQISNKNNWTVKGTVIWYI